MRRMIRLVIFAGGLVALLAVVCNVLLAVNASGKASDTAESASSSAVALVFGAKVYEDGQASTSLATRVDRAVELYKLGRVNKLLMSGDHTRENYDEPAKMKELAMQAGVPAAAISMDFAGIDTWDSCIRAKDVFDISDAVLVTQDFHMDRALYLCEAAGLSVTGSTVSSEPLPSSVRIKLYLREVPAAMKAVLDSILTPNPAYPVDSDAMAA